MELETPLPPTKSEYWRSVTPIDSFWACAIPIWFMFFMLKAIEVSRLVPWLLGLLPEPPDRAYEFPWHWYLLDGVVLPLYMAFVVTWLIRNLQVGWLILAHIFVAVMLFPHLVSVYSYSIIYTPFGATFYMLFVLLGYMGSKYSKNGFMVAGLSYFLSSLVILTASTLYSNYFPDPDRPFELGTDLFIKYAIFDLILALVAGAAFYAGRVAVSKIISPATTE